MLHAQPAGRVGVLGGEPGERPPGVGGGRREAPHDGPQGVLDDGAAGVGVLLPGPQQHREQSGEGVRGVGVQRWRGGGVGRAERGVQGGDVGGRGHGAAVGAVQRAEQSVVRQPGGQTGGQRRQRGRRRFGRGAAGEGRADGARRGPRVGPAPLLGRPAGREQVAVRREQVVQPAGEAGGGPPGAVFELADGGVVVADHGGEPGLGEAGASAPVPQPGTEGLPRAVGGRRVGAVAVHGRPSPGSSLGGRGCGPPSETVLDDRVVRT